MTKLRIPSSIEDAVLRCADVLGWPEASAAVGKSERLVRAWSDPDDDRRIPLSAGLALDRAMRERGHGQPILTAYQALLTETHSARAGGCPMQAFLGVARQFGPLAEAVTRAVDDGVIDASERREITRAGCDLIDQIRALIETVEPPAIDVPVPFKGRVT